MRCSTLTLISLFSTAYTAHLPQRVEQTINPRAEYIGGWAWATSDTCSGAWSTTCDTSNGSCCPTGETCFNTGYGSYCCPTTEDCLNKLLTLPACADQKMDMYPWPYPPRYFCCLAGLIAIVPYSGSGGLCLPADQEVPASEILTASSQIGVGISRTEPPISPPTSTPPVSGTVSNYPSYTNSASSSPTTSTTTNNNSDTITSSGIHLNHTTITGLIIGGIALVIVVFIVCVIRRRRHNKNKLTPYIPTRLPPVFIPPTSKPMYVSTGQEFYDPPHGSNANRASNAPAAQSGAVTPNEQQQSPVPANAVPVSPMSPPPPPPAPPPPPPYGSAPSARYVELHGQGSLRGGPRGAGATAETRHVAGQGAVEPQELGSEGWRGGESITGRQEM